MWEKISLPALSAEKRPLMCLQRPGELLYVPSAWAHLTVNVGDAVAIGVNSMLHTPRDGKLLRKAARLGDPEAATHFGDMYGDANMLYQGTQTLSSQRRNMSATNLISGCRCPIIPPRRSA